MRRLTSLGLLLVAAAGVVGLPSDGRTRQKGEDGSPGAPGGA
jgi:hypothetical protein